MEIKATTKAFLTSTWDSGEWLSFTRRLLYPRGKSPW